MSEHLHEIICYEKTKIRIGWSHKKQQWNGGSEAGNVATSLLRWPMFNSERGTKLLGKKWLGNGIDEIALSWHRWAEWSSFMLYGLKKPLRMWVVCRSTLILSKERLMFYYIWSTQPVFTFNWNRLLHLGELCQFGASMTKWMIKVWYCVSPPSFIPPTIL